MKVKKDINSTRQMNVHLERRELDSRGLMNMKNHHNQTPQGFSEIKLHRYNKSRTKEYDLDLEDHYSKKPS